MIAAVIHGDYNAYNILVQSVTQQPIVAENGTDYEHHSIIDFGDVCDSYLLFEIAIACASIMEESKTTEPLTESGHILAGFYEQIELSEMEQDLLKVCIAARLCQLLVLQAYSHRLDPDNEYLLKKKNGWKILLLLWSTPKPQLYGKWNEIIATYKH